MSGTDLVNKRHGHTGCQLTPILAHEAPAICLRVWRTISRSPQALAESILVVRRVTQAYDELVAMSDPELQYMGIGRSDIPAVVSGTYHEHAPIVSHPASSSRRERSPSSDRCDELCDQGVNP